MFQLRHFSKLWAALAVLVLLTGVLIAADATLATGVIEGTVLSSAGKPIAKVKVIAFNLDTGDAYETTTDSEGVYVFRGLTKGDYELSIYHQGYEVYSSPELKVDEQRATRHDIRLTEVSTADRQ